MVFGNLIFFAFATIEIVEGYRIYQLKIVISISITLGLLLGKIAVE